MYFILSYLMILILGHHRRFLVVVNVSSYKPLFVIVKLFPCSSCVYIDSLGSSHKVDLDNFEPPKADLLLPFSARIIDGINRSDPRRRALIFFCFEYFNVTATDALLLSIDHHGFDVLAKVPEKAVLLDVPRQYVWREFRFSFKEAAKDIEDFCRMLVELEEEALQSMKSYSGL